MRAETKLAQIKEVLDRSCIEVIPGHEIIQQIAGIVELPDAQTPQQDKPHDWDFFLAQATDTFVRKDTDYNSKFMRSLIQHQNNRGLEAAWGLWAWEVDKKLDRLRSYLERGTLLVEGEGVANSAQDIFIYTVQFTIFLDYLKPFRVQDALQKLNDRDFFAYAVKKTPTEWVRFLVDEGLIGKHETGIKKLLTDYMTGS